MRMPTDSSLFNAIAPVYGLFAAKQEARFAKVIHALAPALDLGTYQTILDVGCGTGALCAALLRCGLTVTGVDAAERMLREARKNPKLLNVPLLLANAADALPFADKHFDVSIASYVAHGMGSPARERLYAEMARVTRHKVIIYDYNQRRSLPTTILEWLEHGDYFHFIQNAEAEMRACASPSGACFSAVRVIPADTHASWYVCDPRLG